MSELFGNEGLSGPEYNFGGFEVFSDSPTCVLSETTLGLGKTSLDGYLQRLFQNWRVGQYPNPKWCLVQTQ